MSSADQLSRPLKLDRDPFIASAAIPYIGRPLQMAFQEISRHIGRQTAFILATGSAGTGKTLLADLIVRACAEKNLSIRRVHRGDLMHMALGQRSDVLLVDEANSVAESMLHALLSGEGKNLATTTVFLGLPSCVGHFVLSKLHPIIIELTPLPPADARLYLLEQANHAGLPDLFTAEALDLIVNGSLGSPRLLRSNASLAYFGAAFAGASQISRKYAASALVGQVPSAATKVRETALAVRAAEQRRGIEVPAEVQKLAEHVDEFVGTPVDQTVEIASYVQEASDGADKLASEDPTQVEGQQAIGIVVNTNGLLREMRPPAADENSDRAASDAPPLADNVWRRRADETPAKMWSDGPQFRTALQHSSGSAESWLETLAFSSTASTGSRRALVVAAVFIGIAAAIIGTVTPSMLTGTNLNSATQLSAPAPIQASATVGRTTAPPPAPTPLTAEDGIAVARELRVSAPQTDGQRLLVLVHGVHVHASPSPGKAIATWPKDLKVAMIEQRGKWTLVEIKDDRRRIKPERGWVFNTFLKDEDREVASSEESK